LRNASCAEGDSDLASWISIKNNIHQTTTFVNNILH